MSVRILVTGGKGQLGHDLSNSLASDYTVTGVGKEELDIRDSQRAVEFLKENAFDVVIHTAAYTDVDRCEANSRMAMETNALGTMNITNACKEIGAKMIYYSTDYVFDGTKGTSYIETDEPNPQTIYGKSKLLGERYVIENLEDYAVLRIAWLYGARGKNFLKTIVEAAMKQIKARQKGRNTKPIKIVDDQIGNPTWTMEVVRQTEAVINRNLKGIFHCTAEGEISWYGFAADIFEALKLDVDICPCSSDEYPRPAPRPRCSSLENKNLKTVGANLMRDYKVALREFLESYGGNLSLLSAP